MSAQEILKKCKQPTECKSCFLYICLQGYAAKPSLFIFARKSLAILTNIQNPFKHQGLHASTIYRVHFKNACSEAICDLLG